MSHIFNIWTRPTMHQFKTVNQLKDFINQNYSSYEQNGMLAIPKENVQSFLTFLFGSNEFRNLLKDPESLLSQTIRQVAEHDLIITFQKEHTLTERYTFTSYHRVLMLRLGDYQDENSYGDPILMHDLYLLHELTHIGTLEMDPFQTANDWQTKMIQNELMASFTSEALIYFILPSIRSRTIKHPVWVDEYLDNQEFRKRDFSSLQRALFREYFADYYTPNPNNKEQQIARFRSFNEAWCQVWAPIFPIVEKSTKKFKEDGNAEEYIQWLHANKHIFTNTSHRFIALLNQPDMLLDMVINSSEFTQAINRYIEGLLQGVANQKITVTDNVAPTIKLFKKKHPLTPTIYSLFTPEVARCIRKVNQSEAAIALQDNNAERKQDEIDKVALKEYIAWTKSVLTGLDKYPYQYFTSGSGEGILKSIATMFTTTEPKVLHVFEGEYEGAQAFSKALNIDIKKHPRPKDQNELGAMFQENNFIQSKWYISQPSGIDGNVWDLFTAFINKLEQNNGKIIVDLAYVGTVAKNYHIPLTSPAISSVVASFSKLGPYYERIGFCYSREQNPLLFGNKWFKNIHSILIALEMMNQLSVFSLAKKYQNYQLALIEYINKTQYFLLTAADSFLIANQYEFLEVLRHYIPETQIFRRGDHNRYCLSPGMRAMISISDNSLEFVDEASFAQQEQAQTPSGFKSKL